MTTFLLILGILICVVLSGFFSGSEMAYSSANKLRLEGEAEDGSRPAGVALYIMEHFDDALSTILIGNNLVNIVASTLGSVLTMVLFRTDAMAWLSTLVITILVIIFGETIPKISHKKAANRYAISYAYWIRGLMILFFPLVFVVVKLVNLITRSIQQEAEVKDQEEAVEELSSIIETAEDEEVLDEDQSELVQAAIDFAEVSAQEAMTARVDVVALDIDDSFQENLSVIEAASVSRIPVYQDSIDHVIGVLYMNHFLKALTESATVDIRSLLMKPCYVYKTMKLPEVLSAMRKARQHLAIVVDEYGGTLGVITMEDVLEEMVGEIWDETDQIEEEVEQKADNIFDIDGDMPIGDFLELVNLPEETFEGESETIGGWCVEEFGDFPKAGDSFTYGSLTVTILAMDNLRVERVRVKVLEE